MPHVPLELVLSSTLLHGASLRGASRWTLGPLGPQSPHKKYLSRTRIARVHAGKISRADVADVIVEALRRPECADATICAAGAATPSGGVRVELSWDPARGMHWRTVESEKTVKEGRSFRDESMWIDVARDEDELKEKPHRRYVAAFLAFLAGVVVVLVNGLVTLARSFL